MSTEPGLRKYLAPKTMKLDEMDDGKGACIIGTGYGGDSCTGGAFADNVCQLTGTGLSLTKCDTGSTADF